MAVSVPVLYFLVPLALLLAAAGVAGFLWAVRSGQYDDVETPAMRMLFEEETGEGRNGQESRTERPTPDSPDSPPSGPPED